MDNQAKVLADQDIMDDILSSQKHLTEVYNGYSNECVNPTLRDDFLNILREEHNIQSSVFTDMQKRGWYAPSAAEQQMINKAKTKYQQISQQL